MSREEWALQRTGEENEPAVADVDQAEQREAVFGQTCPIETAVDVPDGRLRARQWRHGVVINGNGCIAPQFPIVRSMATAACGRMPGTERCTFSPTDNGLDEWHLRG